MEVEHPAIYKPAPELKAALLEPGIRQRRKEVYDALKAFDEGFEDVISRASPNRSD